MNDDEKTSTPSLAEAAHAVALFDARGVLVAENAQFRELIAAGVLPDTTAMNAEALLPKLEPVPAPHAEKLYSELGLSPDSGTQGETWVRAMDGSLFALHRHRLSDGQTLLVLAEETERAQAIETLLSEKVRLSALLDHAPALISSKDLDGHVTSMNQAFQLLFDDHATLIGKNVFEIFPAEVAETLWANDQKAQLAATHCQELVQLRNGDVRTYDTLKFPLKDGQGRLTGTGAISLDITERLRAEEERDNLEAQLTHAQRLESVGMLAGGIAHDFNNLLAVIFGGLELTRRAMQQAGLDTTSAENASHAAGRAAELVKQLLTYAGRSRVELSPLDLNEAVRGVAQLCAASLSKKITLAIELPDEQLAVLGNAGQLGQIVLNLVTNAADALDQEAGQIVVRTTRMPCEAEALTRLRPDERLPEGDYALLEVQDNGPGIDPATLDRIFDPFFSTKFSGRGLGLAIVHGAVRTHRGAIDVTSTPGVGTFFRIYLPVTTSAPPRQANKASPPPLQPASKHRGLVLVVDDEPSVQKTTATMAHALGFDVVVASDGAEAVEQMRLLKADVHVIIMDLHMPRLNGNEALQQLRAEGHTVPCILASGNASELEGDYRASGFSGRLDKPFTLRQLEAAIHAAQSQS